jgi:hypothetical protein
VSGALARGCGRGAASGARARCGWVARLAAGQGSSGAASGISRRASGFVLELLASLCCPHDGGVML